jgi:hypothetical protein
MRVLVTASHRVSTVLLGCYGFKRLYWTGLQVSVSGMRYHSPWIARRLESLRITQSVTTTSRGEGFMSSQGKGRGGGVI